MNIKRPTALGAAIVWIGWSWAGAFPCEAVTLNQPGYSATLLVTVPDENYSTMEVDQNGSLYLPGGLGGIQRITSGGVVSTFSSVTAGDLALLPSGAGYASGGDLCHCVSAFQSDGQFSTLHQDSLGWISVALSPNGVLYATEQSINGPNLYTIDRATGQASIVVAGGPGPGGGGLYFSLAFGPDGKLYACGSLDVTLAGNRLFRLDGNRFTAIAVPPHGGFDLALDPFGKVYVTTNINSGGGYRTGELWVLDPAAGTSTLLMTGGFYIGAPVPHPTFQGVGYDAGTGITYVVESGKIWAISKNQTQVKRGSWGAVKAFYHR